MPSDRQPQGVDGYVIRRVSPAEQRAMAVTALRERRSDVATQRGWDLAFEEMEAEIERVRAEERQDVEAIQAHSNLTQSELDDLAEMLGVERDAPYGEVKAALAKVLNEGRPGVMHPVDKAFYDLAIKERDFERRRVDRLEADRAKTAASSRTEPNEEQRDAATG